MAAEAAGDQLGRVRACLRGQLRGRGWGHRGGDEREGGAVMPQFCRNNEMMYCELNIEQQMYMVMIMIMFMIMIRSHPFTL